MPYNVTGCDSAGERHEYVMDDTGAVTGASPGSDVLTAWLATIRMRSRSLSQGETCACAWRTHPLANGSVAPACEQAAHRGADSACA